MSHILSARQFTPEYHAEVFEEATEMRVMVQSPEGRRDLAQRHLGMVVATMFYEPSTRTRLSFESAAVRLGAGYISTENAGEYSSAIKGESLEDTTETVGRFADIMVLRHKQTGAAEIAAGVNALPVINAGDGKGEHPTQALLDLYTIHNEKHRLSGLNVVIGGDLANGRTARSLAMMLSQYEANNIRFVSTPDFQMGTDVKEHLNWSGTSFSETDDMFSAFEGADVVYWTRLQRERLDAAAKSPEDPAGHVSPSAFSIGQAALQVLPADAIIMHPLPRVDEIETSVDADPRAKYFDQVENGLYVRMALLDQILTDL